jgi:hypothetical protein
MDIGHLSARINELDFSQGACKRSCVQTSAINKLDVQELLVQREVDYRLKPLAFSLAEEGKLLEDALWAAMNTAKTIPGAKVEVRTWRCGRGCAWDSCLLDVQGRCNLSWLCHASTCNPIMTVPACVALRAGASSKLAMLHLAIVLLVHNKVSWHLSPCARGCTGDQVISMGCRQ